MYILINGESQCCGPGIMMKLLLNLFFTLHSCNINRDWESLYLKLIAFYLHLSSSYWVIQALRQQINFATKTTMNKSWQIFSSHSKCFIWVERKKNTEESLSRDVLFSSKIHTVTVSDPNISCHLLPFILNKQKGTVTVIIIKYVKSFNKNFFNDWKVYLKDGGFSKITDLEKCNFNLIYKHLTKLKEQRLNTSKEEKQKVLILIITIMGGGGVFFFFFY